MTESQNGLNTGLNTSVNTGAQCATNSLENPLWQYACQFYSQPGVETALLELQDNHGADINLILQALWLASIGSEWTASCIPDDYQKWMNEQVLPLRQMRRTMKVEWPEEKGKEYEDFRQQVKKLELKAEQVALGMLFLTRGSYVDSNEVEKEAGSVKFNLTQLAHFSKIDFENFKALSGLV